MSHLAIQQRNFQENELMKVLITGSNSQLGQELQHTLPKGVKLHACDAKSLDITNAEKVCSTIEKLQPDIVINTAAYTAVDAAETQQEIAYAVNAIGAKNIARACRKFGSRLIHISTDFVFSGDSPLPYLPDDKPEPVNVYGNTKYQGELAVIEEMEGEALIIRTAWMYSIYGQNFVKTILRLLRDEKKLSVVCDQIGSPTWARPLAAKIWKAALSFKKLKGVYHLSDAGMASRFDFAVAIQSEALKIGLLDSKLPISPIRSRQPPSPAQRPANGALDCSKTYEYLCLTPVHWQQYLGEMMREIKAGE